jgi:hypothetical protein
MMHDVTSPPLRFRENPDENRLKKPSQGSLSTRAITIDLYVRHTYPDYFIEPCQNCEELTRCSRRINGRIRTLTPIQFPVRLANFSNVEGAA